MVLVIQTIFFLSLFMIFYVYIGYPILVFILSIFNNRQVRKASCEPFVTILIAAYNEEDSIANTIKNKLDLDYPKEKLEIIVVSDDSTDKTDEIVLGFEQQGVKLLRQDPRAGKTSALNLAVPQAKGSLIIFSDANSIYAPETLKKLVANFSDPEVGYVTGKMIYVNEDGSTIGDGCSVYMRYENFLRWLETKNGSIVGVDGGIDAIRKELYKPMNPDQLPDFVLPLKVVEQGFRVVYEPKAILKEPSLNNSEDEYKMRVRVSLRALWALYDMRHLLTFTRPSPSSACTLSHLRTFAFSFLYSWQLWSHKALRYLCFFFLIGAYFTNLALWQESSFYKSILIIQNLSYLCATVFSILNKKAHLSRLLYLFNYFVLLNIASAHAFVKFLFRQKQVMWTPRKG